MKMMNRLWRFMVAWIAWMLVGVVVVIISPIIAYFAAREKSDLAAQLQSVANNINQRTSESDEDTRAVMDGDEMLRNHFKDE